MARSLVKPFLVPSRGGNVDGVLKKSVVGCGGLVAAEYLRRKAASCLKPRYEPWETRPYRERDEKRARKRARTAADWLLDLFARPSVTRLRGRGS